jgi:predicted alpha/beta superfamily hydrolase
MMQPVRQFVSTVAVFAVLLGVAKSAIAEDAVKDVVIGEERTFFSRTLNEQRTIFVSKPGNYDQTDARYPLLLVLDGRNPFYYTSAVSRYLGASEIIPDLLIVAVANPAASRGRDLTPPATATKTRELEPTGGGSANFRAFIANELLPWVDKNYRTRPYRILVGHSYGGLFVIDTLLTDPKLFTAYIAISPSLAWDELRLVERADRFFDPQRELNATLFLTAGNDARLLRSGVKKLAGVLDEKAPAGFDWRFVSLPEETHGSVALRSVYQGLEFVFADWSLRNPLETYSRFGIEGIERFYAKRAAKYGETTQRVPEGIMRAVSRELLDTGRLDELSDLLARRRDTVRPPSRFLEQIANEYRARGRADRAIDFYRQALQADPENEGARKALAGMGVPQS